MCYNHLTSGFSPVHANKILLIFWLVCIIINAGLAAIGVCFCLIRSLIIAPSTHFWHLNMPHVWLFKRQLFVSHRTLF